MLSMAALTLLLSILLACDTEATPIPAPAPQAAIVIEPNAQPQATAEGEMAAPDPAPAVQGPARARAEAPAPAPAPVATEEPAPTEAPTPTLAPTATPVPTPTPEPTPTLAPTATPVPTPTPEPTPTPAPTATPVPTPTEVPTPATEAEAMFDRLIPELMNHWDVPGGALAIAKDGRLVMARGYGLADIDQEEPVQADTLFRIASISKPITAFAILQLVERGELALDDQVFSILDEFEAPSGATMDPRLEQITVRHLLQHSGGWDPEKSYDAMSIPWRIEQELGVSKPVSCRDVITFMLGQPLDLDPGSEYAYSNFGYCLLGRIIEEKTGLSYEDYVKEQVLEPMGITRMRIGGTLPEERAEGEVTYYDFPGQGLAHSVIPGTPYQVPWPYGGFYVKGLDSVGGWIASTIDLVRFVTAVDGSRPPQMLEPHTVTLMTERPSAPLWLGTSYYYGIGWLIRPAGDNANWWHNGRLPGSMSMLVRTHDGFAWAVLFNSKPEDEPIFRNEVDKLIWQGIHEVSEWPSFDLFVQYGYR